MRRLRSSILIFIFLQFFCLGVVNAKSLSEAAVELTLQPVVYNPAYFKIAYPMGDVPKHFGVCTDVVIRAYRKLDIDLQELVHKDMHANFEIYPKNWGLKKPDTNIDHRRVPNLMKFFSRYGDVLKTSQNAKDYKAGEIVAWRLANNATHIGILVVKKSRDGKRNLVVHNIGMGQVMEDCLFDFKIIGHYKYPK